MPPTSLQDSPCVVVNVCSLFLKYRTSWTSCVSISLSSNAYIHNTVCCSTQTVDFQLLVSSLHLCGASIHRSCCWLLWSNILNSHGILLSHLWTIIPPVFLPPSWICSSPFTFLTVLSNTLSTSPVSPFTFVGLQSLPLCASSVHPWPL